MPKDLAIILHSGGLCSAVAAALAGQRYRIVLIHVEGFGPAPARRKAVYDEQVGVLKPYREHTLALPFLNGLEPQTHASATLADLRSADASATALIDLMPLVAVAARYAVHYQAAAVYAGLRVGPLGEELSAATEFGQIWNEMWQIPCRQAELELVMPLLELEPWQVVDVGVQINVALEKTWSCSEEGTAACGTCRGCRAREAAFTQAVKADPLKK